MLAARAGGADEALVDLRGIDGQAAVLIQIDAALAAAPVICGQVICGPSFVARHSWPPALAQHRLYAQAVGLPSEG